MFGEHFQVSTSQRLTVTATCPMQLKLFPMDSQTCKLEIESYGYTTADIDYFWGKRRVERSDPRKVVAFNEFTLPQFRRTGYRVNITKATTSSGKLRISPSDREAVIAVLSCHLCISRV